MEQFDPASSPNTPRSFPRAVALVALPLLWAVYRDAGGYSAYVFGQMLGALGCTVVFAYIAFLIFRRSRTVAWAVAVTLVVVVLANRGADLRKRDEAYRAFNSQVEKHVAAVVMQLQAVSDAEVLALPTTLSKADLTRGLAQVESARTVVGAVRAFLEDGKGYGKLLLASGVSSHRIRREIQTHQNHPGEVAAVAVVVECAQWLDAASDLLRGLDSNLGHWRIPVAGELVIADDVLATTKQGILSARERLLQAEKRIEAAAQTLRAGELSGN